MLSSFPKNEIVKLYLQSASTLTGGNDSLILSFIFTRQAYLTNPNDSKVLEKFTEILFGLGDYHNAFKCSEKWFSLTPQESDLVRGNMFFIKGVSAQFLKKFDVASENLRKAMNTFMQSSNQEKFEEAKRIYEIELPKAKENPYVNLYHFKAKSNDL